MMVVDFFNLLIIFMVGHVILFFVCNLTCLYKDGHCFALWVNVMLRVFVMFSKQTELQMNCDLGLTPYS